MSVPTTRPGPSEGWSEYMHDWRTRHPMRVEENRIRQRAYGRALSILRELHEDEFAALYEEQRVIARMEWQANTGDRHG